jgi:hypothetical protein
MSKPLTDLSLLNFSEVIEKEVDFDTFPKGLEK